MQGKLGPFDTEDRRGRPPLYDLAHKKQVLSHHTEWKFRIFCRFIELPLKISFLGVRNGSFYSQISENLETKAHSKAAQHTGCQVVEQTD